MAELRTVQDLRAQSLSAVFGAIARGDATTRTHIAAVTGLSAATVSVIIADLIRWGVVCDTGSHLPSTGGRRRAVLEVNPFRSVSMAVVIARELVVFSILDLRGDVIVSFEEPVSVASITPAEFCHTVARVAEREWAKLSDTYETFSHLLLAVPAIVDAKDEAMMVALNLGWLERYDLKGQLESDLNIAGVTVAVRSAPRLAALAEYRLLREDPEAGSPSGVVYLSADTATSGAVIMDGKLIVGATGVAGEVEHISVDYDGRPCECGNWGCLSTFITPGYLLGASRSSSEAEIEVLAAKVIDRACIAGTEESVRMDALVEPLSAAFLGFVAAYDAEWVVLGGYLAQVWPLVESRVLAAIDKRRSVTAHSLGGLRGVRTAQLGNQALLVGANAEVIEVVASQVGRFGAESDRS